MKPSRWMSLNACVTSVLATALVGCGDYPQGWEEGDVRTESQYVTSTSPVFVNQLGYLSDMKKQASVVGTGCSGVAFTVKDSSNAVVFSGTTGSSVVDPGSGDTVCRADFSTMTATGTGFTVNVTGIGTSDAFPVFTSASALLPDDLYQNAVYYFTWHRLGSSSVNITLPTTNWAYTGTVRTGMTAAPSITRDWAARPGDATLTDYQSWANGITMNVDGGHMDAGDFGKYNDNAVQAMWVLMNLIEFQAPTTALPSLPDTNKDLLSEAIHGTKFLKGTLPASSSKLAAHKCHDDAWDPDQPWGNGTPYSVDGPATSASAVTTSNSTRRHCMGGSSTATYAVARGLAQMARVAGTRVDSTYWTTAKSAWTRVQSLAPGATDGVWTGTNSALSPGFAVGGGPYNDGYNFDDRFAAAVELYLTAKVKGESYASYLSVVNSSSNDCRSNGNSSGTPVRCLGFVSRRHFDWEADATAGNLSLMAYHLANGGTCTSTSCTGGIASEVDMVLVRNAIVAESNAAKSAIAANGYPVPISGNDYPWGSNKVVLHSALIAGYAFELTGDISHKQTMHQALDYIFGQNTHRISFVTGYGNHFAKTAHDRQSFNRTPKGWLIGGPINASEVNDYYPYQTLEAGGTSPGDWGGQGCGTGSPACATQDGSPQSSCCSMVATPRTAYAAKNFSTRWEDFDWSWGSREVTVDWNAPLVWVVDFLRQSSSPPAACTTNGDCNDSNPCTVDTCSAGTCSNAAGNAGTVCRASQGSCDVAETCTGTATSCPADSFVSVGTVCRASTGVCDPAETCTGSSAACPSDSLSTSGTVCRAAVGPCDVAETCTGSSSACPSDAIAASGVVCRAASGGCDKAEKCNGVATTCPVNTFKSAGTVCRSSAGTCDVAETCSGTSGACPSNTFVASGTVCRAASGECDVAESCSGSSASCPTDGYVASGVSCSGGTCDGANMCVSCTPPSAPTGLTATAGNAQVTLSWTTVSGATSYNIKRSTTSGGSYTTIATGVTSTTYINTGLTNGTTYYYVVSAVAGCEGSNSSQASGSPSAGSDPCANPVNLTGSGTYSVNQTGTCFSVAAGVNMNGAMISAMNSGTAYTTIEWYGGTSENTTACTQNSHNLSGNGAQLNNFTVGKNTAKSVAGVAKFIVKSQDGNSYSVQLSNQNWQNGNGCSSPAP